MKDKKVLIIANNCLSEHNSNGRTLLNLLKEFPRDNICQIYTSGEMADESFAGASLRITNGEVIQSYFRASDYKMPSVETVRNVNPGSVINKKSAATMLLRDIVWAHSFRTRKAIIEWVKSQRPDCIILQIGDASLQIEIATYIAKQLNLPLVTFNTEDYYFKKYDYMKRTHRGGPVYQAFHDRFRRSFQKLMSLSPACIYNCDGLKRLYDDEFNTDSTVLFCGTDFERVPEVDDNGLILYAGNLSLGRHKGLIEIARVLHEIDDNLSLDVYGGANEEVGAELNAAVGLNYHGFVDYDQICERIKDSRLLVHVESFDDYNAMDTQFAFSTKLADYLASGVPVLLYGPTTGEGICYIRDHSAAFVADNKDSLNTELTRALYDQRSRHDLSLRAVELAERNHDIRKNGIKFCEIIEKTCKDNVQ